MKRSFRIAIVGGALLVGCGVPMLPANAGAGTISGVAFTDGNRNGSRDPGETARAGDTLWLYNSSGTAVASATTASDGSYAFTNLADGSYRVDYSSTTWRSIRNDVVPTTSDPFLRPARTAVVPGPALDFGWRPIVRSTTAGSPVSSYTGPQGLHVEAYNDVVDPQQVYALLTQGHLAGEAPWTTVRLDLSSSTVTTTSVGATDGRYTSFTATCFISWGAWLDRGATAVAHEYGHAWSLYHAYLAQQDPSFAGYLQARQLTGDSRIGSTSDWYPSEMIAEDYRQLLGPGAGRAATQANRDIPLAADVPGLADYLTTVFEQASSAPSPSPSPSPSASASPSPSGSPSASPSTSPSSSPSASAAPSPTASPAPSPSASALPSPTTSTTPAPSASASPSPSASPTKGKGTTCRRC
jgi:hypothetical protein